MKKRRNKIVIITITIAIAISLILFILLKKMIVPKERKILAQDTILCLLDVDKDPRGEVYELPEELIEWIAQSLESGNWDKKLKEISAEYITLTSKEKQQLFEYQNPQNVCGLYAYCEEEPLLLKDKWYIVSLSEYGEDLVIESYNGMGKKCVYFFHNFLSNNVYPEMAMYAAEKRETGSPYFISWDGINYMAVPVWREENNEILGMEVYDYYSTDFVGVITGIQVDENGERKVKSQEYLFTTSRGGDMGGTWSLEVLE